MSKATLRILSHHDVVEKIKEHKTYTTSDGTSFEDFYKAVKHETLAQARKYYNENPIYGDGVNEPLKINFGAILSHIEKHPEFYTSLLRGYPR